MNLNDRLLKIRELSPLDKLILGLVLETPVPLMNLHDGYYKTCSEIAKELGTTREKVLNSIDSMKESGYVTNDVRSDKRVINITKKLVELLFPLNEMSLTEPIDEAMVDREDYQDLSFLD